MFITNLIVQTSPCKTQVAGTSTSQTRTTLKHHCPHHSKKEIEYYCQTCRLGLCSKCIYKNHNDHKTLDLEYDFTREMVVEELAKSEQFITNKIEDREKIHTRLLETSEKLKLFCDEACAKKCKNKRKDIKQNFGRNESKLTEARQKVMKEINDIKTDLGTSCPINQEPSLNLIYSLTKLQELQKLCGNMKTDIPPVTYEEWRQGGVNICDLLGSTVTKPLYQSFEKTVFKFNCQDIKNVEVLYSEDKHEINGMVSGCSVRKVNDRYVYIDIGSLKENNPQAGHWEIRYTVTILNKDEDKKVISETKTEIFSSGFLFWRSEIQLPWDTLTDPSEGFINNEGQFYVGFDQF
ncbi:hypothetical protein LOTGIDRAFT_168167 [Lottia gigantea]|uniref:B box-type domain-containing protein n=1 Tax=Lottia gigantea TaxID=225164 RepID=V3ZQX2_LOTGI|nr:hypothetical protein LOTGIDRAFT_168167 [Lottia gigantea]ESO84910.1 hypothetical protein LOTGIDRAFT_168167 [Lottia gigantea]